MLLSEQGVDFTGGDLCIWQQDTPKVGCGDLVAFTAKTRHRVSRIQTGERTALICFGRQ